MSHFPRADKIEKSYSKGQIRRFVPLLEATRHYGIEVYHMANSAAIFDLPDCYFGAARCVNVTVPPSLTAARLA